MSSGPFVELENRPIWVSWQTEDRPGAPGSRPTKVPYAPDGRKARANDPRTWGTRPEAASRAAQLPRPYGIGGVGIELGELGDGTSVGGLDFDACREPNGQLAPWATEALERFDSYSEVSPSQTGVKLLFTYTTADLTTLRSMGLIAAGNGTRRPGYGRQFKRGAGDHPAAIELHLGNRYFAITDQQLSDAPDELRPVPLETLVWLLQEAGPAFVKVYERRQPANGKDNSRSGIAFAKAAVLRRQGKTFDEMCDALRADPATADWAREKGEASDKRELRRIWHHKGDRAELPNADVTEDGIATIFAEHYRDRLRYCHDTGSWFAWDGNIWRQEGTMLAFHWCRQTCRQISETVPSNRVQAILRRASTAAAVERFARADRVFAVNSEIWDRDPFLLGTPGGTVDLRSGTLRTPMQGDYITKQTTVAPAESPDCPLWLHFLDDATRGDALLVRYLRQWCGYCLTGDIREHALLFIFGPGGNGKSVFLNTVSRILGDYATIAAMDTFAASKGERHPADLAMLRGARLVCVSETDEGHAWAENRIKTLTGGDPISARFMRENFFTYRPQFKITVIGNHKPVLRNVDDAVCRRFNLAPFIHKPTTPDKALEQKLHAEHPAILRWMIEGCLDWRMHGLIRPSVVTAATSQYFAEEDTIRQWIEECCELSDRPPHVADTNASLFASWRNYCAAHSEDFGSQKAFSRRLHNLGYEPIKDEHGIRGRGFKDIRVQIWRGEGYTSAE
jgi:putative DNA primase/helicase